MLPCVEDRRINRNEVWGLILLLTYITVELRIWIFRHVALSKYLFLFIYHFCPMLISWKLIKTLYGKFITGCMLNVGGFDNKRLHNAITGHQLFTSKVTRKRHSSDMCWRMYTISHAIFRKPHNYKISPSINHEYILTSTWIYFKYWLGMWVTLP